ncbi:hypothetical protein BTVI_59055 [Pitangus sulphuratus]|nr:hypothetical protein BTVI_59055 [Pitangus sulphuratus]
MVRRAAVRSAVLQRVVMIPVVLGIELAEQGTARAFKHSALIDGSRPLVDRMVSWYSGEYLYIPPTSQEQSLEMGLFLGDETPLNKILAEGRSLCAFRCFCLRAMGNNSMQDQEPALTLFQRRNPEASNREGLGCVSSLAVGYKFSPLMIYSSSSSEIYEMRSPFILKVLCSLVGMMKAIVPKARGEQEFIQPVRLWLEEVCKPDPKTRGGLEKQQPLVLQNSQTEILNDAILALQAGGEQYFHQLNDLNSLASLRALQQDRL